MRRTELSEAKSKFNTAHVIPLSHHADLVLSLLLDLDLLCLLEEEDLAVAPALFSSLLALPAAGDRDRDDLAIAADARTVLDGNRQTKEAYFEFPTAPQDLSGTPRSSAGATEGDGRSFSRYPGCKFVRLALFSQVWPMILSNFT